MDILFKVPKKYRHRVLSLESQPKDFGCEKYRLQLSNGWLNSEGNQVMYSNSLSELLWEIKEAVER